MAKLDPDLDADAEHAGAGDDPDRVVDSEALGGRHRRRFGYGTEGAQENDHDIDLKGRKPLKIVEYKRHAPESRIANFSHGITTHHISTVHNPKRPTTI